MQEEPPLIIDLDGTLISSDLLVETGLLFLRDQPLGFPRLLVWLAKGKSRLKHELALAADLDVSALPYNPRVVELITRERGRGRRVVLATASHERLARKVASHLKVFDAVLATSIDRNLSADVKRRVLVDTFGEYGYDYVGNSHDDLPVWRSARQSFVVDASPSVSRKARALGNVTSFITTPRAPLQDWFRALRLHQWLKNLLIFVPLLAAHKYTEWPMVRDAILAFLSFGLCASSVYILNDLIDLSDDRHHPRKRQRPFASGRLSVRAGLVACPLLLGLAFGLGEVFLPRSFTLGLGCYYALTLAYSLWLKRRMVIDVIALAGLYTLRIIVGAVALGIPLSFWLLAFSMFMFLSLALVKRYAELYQVQLRNESTKAHGRGYFASDLSMLAALGAASGYMAVMVMALYINDSRTTQLYRHPEFIWLACPLLLTWITRVWMLAHRGAMNEDPVIYAARDRVSLGIGGLMAIVFLVAI